MINLASNLKKTLLLEHEMSCLCGCVSPLPQPTKKSPLALPTAIFLYLESRDYFALNTKLTLIVFTAASILS